MNEYHVFPTRDLVEHDTETDDCVCGPLIEPVPRDDGSMGWVITHHSLDGREKQEQAAMSTTQSRYRKKPVTIEAMQWDGRPSTASDVIDWILASGGTASYHCLTDACGLKPENHTIAVETMEGRSLDARPGWWFIRGVEGEFYPCKPSVFAATYEAVEQA